MSATETKMVKSAGRVLEVFEYFDANRQHASVMDVSRALNYPQSSTSELLRCLTSLGYLSYDALRRAYKPTARVAILGAWVEPELFRRGHLLSLMDALSERAGKAVVLATTVGLAVRYIHVIEAARHRPAPQGALQKSAPQGALQKSAPQGALQKSAPQGALQKPAPQSTQQKLLRSTTGRLFLSTFEDRKLRAVVHRLNAEESDQTQRVPLREVLADVEQIRRQGYAQARQADADRLVAMLLPSTDADQPLAIGLGGEALSQAQIEPLAAMLREAVARACPPSKMDTPPHAGATGWSAPALSAA